MYLEKIKNFKAIRNEKRSTVELILHCLKTLPFKASGSYHLADVGCGLGHMYPEIMSSLVTDPYLKERVQYQGLDFDQSLLSRARDLYAQHPDMFLEFDYLNQTFPAPMYDVMLVKRTLQHVPEHQLREAVLNLAQGLTNQGYMIVVETDWRTLELSVNTPTARKWVDAIQSGKIGANPNVNRQLFSLIESIPELEIVDINYTPMYFKGNEVIDVLDPDFAEHPLPRLKEDLRKHETAWQHALCAFDVRFWVMKKA